MVVSLERWSAELLNATVPEVPLSHIDSQKLSYYDYAFYI